jgi:TRAP-type C4-dicarboxylate transport system permease small subunit
MTSPFPEAGARRPLAQSAPVVVLRHVVEAVTALGVAGFAVLICLQVFFRYALNSSLTWSEEVVQFMLLWVVMLGSAAATDRGAHIVLNPLDDRVGPRGRLRLARVAHLGTIAFCACLAWYGWQLMLRASRMTSPAADIPMAWVYAAMPVGSVLIILFALVHMIDGTDQRLDPMDERT